MKRLGWKAICSMIVISGAIGFGGGTVFSKNLTQATVQKRIFKDVSESHWQEGEYHSQISSDSCTICSARTTHKNEENVGIVSLKDGSVFYVNMNPCNAAGEFTQQAAAYSEINFNPRNVEQSGIMISTDVSRGYAYAAIELSDEHELDMEQVQKLCCDDCIEKILADAYSTKPYNIGIINFQTGDFVMFTPDTISFLFGDFYVDCNLWRTEYTEATPELHLMMFHCPDRVG